MNSNPPSIIIISPELVNDFKQHVIEDNWKWCFFGDDIALKEKLCSKLGYQKNISYAKEMQSISLAYKQSFLDWIASIGRMQAQSWWYGTNIAYKCPVSSNLFLNYCILLLIKKLIDQNARKVVFIIENPKLGKSIEKNIGAKNILVKIHTYKVLKKIKYLLFGNIYIFLKDLYANVREAMEIYNKNKHLPKKYRYEVLNSLKGKIDILFATWITPTQFNKNNDSFYDQYLGKLFEYYKKKKLDIKYINFGFINKYLMKQTLKSDEIIPIDIFLGYKDIFKALIVSSAIRWKSSIPRTHGLDLIDIFIDARKNERRNVFHHYLYYLVIKKLIRSGALNFKNIVYPFENQPLDKMLIKAIHDARLHPKIIGYQHGNMPYLLLNYFLGKNEKKEYPQPDYIFTCTGLYKRMLKKANYRSAIYNGGSISSRYKISINNLKNDRGPENKNYTDILALLPGSIVDAKEMLFFLKRQAGFNFLIKAHPILNEQMLKDTLQVIPGNFSFVNDPLESLYKKTDYVIYNSTLAGLESLLNGKIIIKYISERIDLDPLLTHDINIPTLTFNSTLDLNYLKNLKNSPIPKDLPLKEEIKYDLWDKIILTT
ncbi:hypothetical protein ACFL5G_03445 [Candidatus Margulisiibacteriota bacterium]